MNRSTLAALLASLAMGGAVTWALLRPAPEVWQAPAYTFPQVSGIERIEMRCANDATATLVREANGWMVQGTTPFEANEHMVARIVDAFASPWRADLVAHPDESVVSGPVPRLDLTVTTDEGSAWSVTVGAPDTVLQTGRDSTWVVPQGVNGAYRVSVELRSRLACDPERYRNLEFWDFTVDQVVSITSEYDGQTLLLVRDGDGWRDHNTGRAVATAAGRRLATALSQPTAERLVQGVAREEAGLNAPARRYRVQLGGRTEVLEVGAEGPPVEGSGAGVLGARRYAGLEGRDEVWLLGVRLTAALMMNDLDFFGFEAEAEGSAGADGEGSTAAAAADGSTAPAAAPAEGSGD
jgi:hypothetical protein